MIDDKQKEIDRLDFEKKLIEADLMRKINSSDYLSFTKRQAEYSVEKFISKINSKNITISDVGKQSNVGGDYCSEVFTRFDFKWNEMNFEVCIPKKIQMINRESFREEDIGKIRLLARVNSCCMECVYECFLIEEISKKLIEWEKDGSSVDSMREEYYQYVRDKWKGK
jgi:hypothetical protein